MLSSITTAKVYHYRIFPDTEPRVVNGDRDGIVNMLEPCALQTKEN